MWTFGKSFFWNNNTFTVICYSVKKKTIEVNFSFFIEHTHTHTHTNKKPLLVVSGQPSLLRLLPDSPVALWDSVVRSVVYFGGSTHSETSSVLQNAY